MLIRNIQPDMYGGGETYQLMLTQEFLENDWEPMIVTSCEKLLSEAKKSKIKAIGAPFCRIQNWSGLKNLLFPLYVMWQWRLKRWYRKIFEEYCPEVINVQSRDDFIAATSVAKKMGIRVIWTDHMDFRSWALVNVDVWYKNWIGKWVVRTMKKVDSVVMISDVEKKWLEKRIGARKNILVINNGVIDRSAEYRSAVAKTQSFVYMGRIVDYKGINELISAFKDVCKKYPGAVLNIYGDGEDFEKYSRMADNSIFFYGATNEPLVALAENDIFVLPSHREGLSLSLLDAAMMKKKIIASDAGGNSEVVKNGKTGLLVPIKDAAKLTEAMGWMIEHEKEAERLAANARRYYEENFNFDKIFTEEMLPLYEK